MNEIMLIGNLTRDPETRTVSGYNGDTPVCSFTIAVNSRRRSGQQNGPQQGQGQDDAQFFRISVWGNRAEAAQRYMKRGHKVFVSGELSARTYTGNDGNVRVSLEVRADDFEFLTSRAEAEARDGGFGAAPASQGEPSPTVQNNNFTQVNNEELPF